MNVAELIVLLNAVEDKTKRVVVSVRTYTQAYPVGYLEPWDKDYLDQVHDDVRLHVSFPEGVSVATRKKRTPTGKSTADRIDGMDRDDLGESPDF